MGIFGWSYPPGAENDPLAPYNEDDPGDEGPDSDVDTDTTWVQITKRTNDPKLRHFERLLDELGIKHRRHGESWHAPILQVPDDRFEEAYALLSSDVFGDGTNYDEIDDDDPVFSEEFYTDS